MSWVSVKDKLPAAADDVLVYSPDDGCYRAWYDNDIWLSYESASSNAPTHWMTMPCLPSQRIPNPSGCYGMTDKLVSGESRPYSVWSEAMDTANDIRDAWESRFGGPYKVLESNHGYEVRYMGEWKETFDGKLKAQGGAK
ncbi:MAG: DUF551 domain-containing protein [Gammaproteobacteria bacterium]|nr:DUF551 domain-containing protein [Gammaproteobacteria bacterium]